MIERERRIMVRENDRERAKMIRERENDRERE